MIARRPAPLALQLAEPLDHEFLPHIGHPERRRYEDASREQDEREIQIDEVADGDRRRDTDEYEQRSDRVHVL